MTFSSIAVEHREKQDQAQKLFIIYSLIGSLVLHIGLLANGLGNFFKMSPQVEDEQIEVAIVDTPTPFVTKPPFEKKLPPKVDSGGGGGGGGGGGAPSKDVSSRSAPVPVVKQPPIQAAPIPVVKQPPIQTAPIPVVKQPPKTAPEPIAKEPLQTTPIEKFVDNYKTPPPQPPQRVAMTPKTIPTIASSPEPIIKPNAPLPIASPTQSPQVSGEPGATGVSNRRPRTMLADSPGSGSGNGSGGGSGNGRGTGVGNGVGSGSGNGFGNGFGDGIGNGRGNGIGNGTGNGIGNGTGNGVGNGKLEGSTVATAPKPPTPKPPKPKPTKLNRDNCIRCDIKYPDRAERQHIEGKPEVAIDYDENGKVTNVRLTRSSGHSELDEAVVEQAREFKLKPTPGGRQGVLYTANFAIRGSDRYREREASQRKKEAQAREAERRERDTLTNNNNENPNGSQQSTAGVITDVPPASNPRRKQRRMLTPSTPETPATNPAQELPSPSGESDSDRQSVQSDTPALSPTPLSSPTPSGY